MPGRIPEGVIDAIREKIDILDLVGSYVNLSRKGDRWWGLCPFHSEKTPSFSVSPDKNLYHCFGCQKGGGVIQFLMDMESLTFPEATRQLAEKAGIEIPDSEGDEKRIDNRRVLEDLYIRVSKTFRWLLLNHPDAQNARDYISARGISDEIAERFKLGWAPGDGEWLYNFLSKKNYSPEFLAETGLFSRKSPRWCFFIDRLIFPVMPDDERVVAFSGRALSDKGPKYLNSPETVLYKKSQHLYGYGQAKKTIRTAKTAILCEGNIDVLACSQAGFQATVAPLGTSFTTEQARLIKRSADSLIILFDGDDAGRNATMKAAIVAENAGLTVKSALIPQNTDPAELLLKKGPSSLKNILENPINIFSYLLDFLISAKSVRSGEAQEEALEKLTPYLEAVGSDVRREAYLRQLADAMNAHPGTVITEYGNRKKPRRTMRRTEKSDDNVGRIDAKTVGEELYLMTAVAVRTEYFTTLRKMLAPELLRDRRALAVYRVLDELSIEGSTPQTQAVVDRLQDDDLKNFILEKASTEIYDERAEETILHKIRLLLERSLKEERIELVKGLARNDADNPEIQNALLMRIREIDMEILKIRQGEDGGNQV